MFDPKNPDNDLPLLPPENLKLSDRTYWQLSKASRAIASLNTYINTNTENVGLLVLGSFLIKEGVASSAIENINTTLESVFQADISSGKISKEDKEVLHYRQATLWGIEQVEKYSAIITNTLITIQSMIEPDKAGIRKIPGTVLMNGVGEVIYTPPVGEETIRSLLGNLEKYVNTDDEIDPLVKLAVIHYQFESIHPFPDGNGRTGRILMILYLVLKGLLKLPIVYLSEYINANKTKYYQVLHGIRENQDRDSLVHYMLVAVEEQSLKTKDKLEAITNLIKQKKQEIDNLGLKIPGTFIDYFFDRPYCSIAMIEKDEKYSRKTIKKYIDSLVDNGILKIYESDYEVPYFVPEYIDVLFGHIKNKEKVRKFTHSL
ncbi:filamentation induced by cAMP protein Fic [candidate division SR1 bacterium RAAC1_SR1_1]|nr:filamentation induced by cAMP protein Fic [candidate division SR1 bacterium RAAC1_SR1_1]